MATRFHDGEGPAMAKKRSRQRGTRADRRRRQHSKAPASTTASPGSSGPPSPALRAATLPDLTAHLVKCGAYEEYKRWREGYRRWREGDAKGACGEGNPLMTHATTDGLLQMSKSWRDGYRSWRAGGLKGARGELEAQSLRSTAADGAPQPGTSLPPVIYDVVAGPGGDAALVPSDGPLIDPISVRDFPEEAVLTVRVFRFFEFKSDEASDWERNLSNVNSGSLFWLPWHLAPNLHTKAGAKYGTWFTIHYVQVYAKHFQSAYHMCNEGFNGGAKTFGSTLSNSTAITGESLPEGYFWYVSPAAGKEHLRTEGWQHLHRVGPFDGKAFLKNWQDQGSPMDAKKLQGVLAKVVDESVEAKVL